MLVLVEIDGDQSLARKKLLEIPNPNVSMAGFVAAASGLIVLDPVVVLAQLREAPLHQHSLARLQIRLQQPLRVW